MSYILVGTMLLESGQGVALLLYLVVGIFLPAFDLGRNILRQMVLDFGMQVRKAVRFDEDTFPCRFRRSVFRSCFFFSYTRQT